MSSVAEDETCVLCGMKRMAHTPDGVRTGRLCPGGSTRFKSQYAQKRTSTSFTEDEVLVLDYALRAVQGQGSLDLVSKHPALPKLARKVSNMRKKAMT